MLFHVHFILAVARQNCHYSVGLLQHFAEFVHHRYLVFVQAVRIAIQRDIHALVPKYFGQRFHVHSALQSPRCKSVAQAVKPFVRYAEMLEYQLKTPLICPHRNVFASVADEILAVALFFQPFEIGQQGTRNRDNSLR